MKKIIKFLISKIKKILNIGKGSNEVQKLALGKMLSKKNKLKTIEKKPKTIRNDQKKPKRPKKQPKTPKNAKTPKGPPHTENPVLGKNAQKRC